MKSHTSTTPPRTPRPPRCAVLAVSHPDGHLEVYAPPHIDVHLARAPVAPIREVEALADEVLEAMLPPRYHDLYRADRLRAVGTTRPLLPSALLAARETAVAIERLDQVDQRERRR